MLDVFEICLARSIKDPGFLPLLSQFFIESGVIVPDTGAFDVLEGAIRSDRIRYFMCMEAGRVIGVVSLTLGFSTFRMRPFALLGDLYVHPGHRGRGAAAALVLAAMDGAHREGCAYVSTLEANKMEGIFERYGWVRSPITLTYEIDLQAAPPSLTLTGEITFD
jgi:GNAT superfamily N-acetyltransferase